MKLEQLITKIHTDIKNGYTNIALSRLMDFWEVSVSPLLDKYYQEQKKMELYAISQRYNALLKNDDKESIEAIRIEGNKIVNSILYQLIEIKNLAESHNANMPVEEDEINNNIRIEKPNNSLASKENFLQKKSENDYQQFEKEWSPNYETERIELDNIINNQGLKARSVLIESINIRIRHELLPLLKKRIEIESNLRRTYKIPYNDSRIEQLKSEITKIINNKWHHIVFWGYLDAESNWIAHMGIMPSYKKEELESDRDKELNTFPIKVFDLVVSILDNDHFEMQLNGSS